jgi:hypothetical protein
MCALLKTEHQTDMTYKIISTHDNVTIIEIVINDVTYQSLIVCNENELDEAVECFANTIRNPITPGN